MKKLTVSIPENLYDAALKVASTQGVSIAQLVTEYLETVVASSRREEQQGKERLVLLFEKGPKYGGKPASRAELHGR